MMTLDDVAIKPCPDFAQLEKVLWGESKPDYVPFYELFVNVEMMEQVLGHSVPARADATAEFYYKAGYDYVPVWPTIPLVRGNRVDTSQGFPIRDWRTFDSYPWPDPSSVTFHDFDAVESILPAGMKTIGQTGSVFETTEDLLGYEQMCVLMFDNMPLVEAVIERLGAILEIAYRGMIELELVGAVVISDDLGHKTQTMVSPAFLRSHIFPWYRRIAEFAHRLGKPCILHSCGQLSSVMDDLIQDVGIDAKHSYEDAILPVTEFAKQYGDRVSILGGFDMDRLCSSTPDEVRAHTRFLLEELGTTGRYALGSGNSIPGFVPVQNYLAMLDEGWKLR